MAGNDILPAKIGPECSFNPTESSYKIFMTFGLVLDLRKKKWLKMDKMAEISAKK